MNRKEFLRQMGLGSAALWAVYCTGLSGCSKESIMPAATVDFSLDLTDSSNTNLNTDGGYVVSNGVVVARTRNGSYAAVSQICTHKGSPNVAYLKSADEFYCNVHAATYTTGGQGLNANGRNGLKTYRTELNGTNLRIYG